MGCYNIEERGVWPSGIPRAWRADQTAIRLGCTAVVAGEGIFEVACDFSSSNTKVAAAVGRVMGIICFRSVCVDASVENFRVQGRDTRSARCWPTGKLRALTGEQARALTFSHLTQDTTAQKRESHPSRCEVQPFSPFAAENPQQQLLACRHA